ncbi:hypothetical protein [Deinococcus hopiensis]|uniref:Uncharacterized protein n=1 Tax=Deinococcus hopiensis KR-140 TaxID=695939 RepID=A0A1W1ULL3_9DEIO|nr:hypothetical protein [Deinococcus hopiensis]SMB81624.1 hypothetical protein SAMN00790413_04649 [Deinococcus hopiensis KR-140]
MARPWQYPFELHTRSEIIERYGCLPEQIQLDEDASENCGWPDLGGTALPRGYGILLDSVLTRVTMSSPDRTSYDRDEAYLLWGTPKRDSGDSFSVWLEEGQPETVGGMIDLTGLNVAFVRVVLSLARRADQVLICTHSQDVVEPTPRALARSVRRSISERWQGDAADRIEHITLS